MNKNRNDITDWLIHFTKDISTEDIVDVYHEYLGGDNHTYTRLDYSNQLPSGVSKYSAFEILKSIIGDCGIRYGYSFRRGKTTLYGGDPVICMTEMPLKSFLEYAKTRDSDSIATYGIAITKQAAYQYGARPVIYGLSEPGKFHYQENSQHKRILPSDILPIQEQYRLVSYDPMSKIDWTHEREWRIKKKHKIENNIFIETSISLEEIEVLNIFEEKSPCDKIILIVSKTSEANEIFDQVLALKDSGSNNYGSEFAPKSIAILVVEKISNEDLEVSKIEDLSIECYFKIEEERLTNEEIIHLKQVLQHSKNVISVTAEQEFHQITKLKKHEQGYYLDMCGSAAIVCYNPRNRYLREMLKIGAASSYGDGYIINAIENVSEEQSVTYHEFIAGKVCDYLNKELDNVFYTKTYID